MPAWVAVVITASAVVSAGLPYKNISTWQPRVYVAAALLTIIIGILFDVTIATGNRDYMAALFALRAPWLAALYFVVLSRLQLLPNMPHLVRRVLGAVLCGFYTVHFIDCCAGAYFKGGLNRKGAWLDLYVINQYSSTLPSISVDVTVLFYLARVGINKIGKQYFYQYATQATMLIIVNIAQWYHTYWAGPLESRYIGALIHASMITTVAVYCTTLTQVAKAFRQRDSDAAPRKKPVGDSSPAQTGKTLSSNVAKLEMQTPDETAKPP